MRIKLPRKCSGQEVVEAFKVASSLQESPDRKWKSKDFIGESQYELGSVKQVVRNIRSMGVKVFSSSFRKERGLFGKKVWKNDFDGAYTFMLEPVVLTDNYEEVKVEVNWHGDDIDVLDLQPHSIEFEDNLRSLFEQILGKFFVQLQSKSV